MIRRRVGNHRGENKLILAIYPQSRGFAFVLFEGLTVPIDWGVHEVRGADKNERCLKRINSLLALHTPDVLVLQDMSKRDTPRARRIQKLNSVIAERAKRRGILVRTYSHAQVLEYFGGFGAVTNHGIAEPIAKRVPALNLHVPPARKPWLSQDPRIGIFRAAALAWMFFTRQMKRDTRPSSRNAQEMRGQVGAETRVTPPIS
jgi:hypothetical protein